MGNLFHDEALHLSFKRELPSRGWRRILDALLRAVCDHSLFCSSVAAVRYIDSEGPEKLRVIHIFPSREKFPKASYGLSL